MGQNTFNKSDCKIFKSTLSPEYNDEIALFFDFLHVDTKSGKFKVDLFFLCVDMIKNGY